MDDLTKEKSFAGFEFFWATFEGDFFQLFEVFENIVASTLYTKKLHEIKIHIKMPPHLEF